MSMFTGAVDRVHLAQPVVGASAPYLFGEEDTWFASQIALLEAWGHPVLNVIQQLGTEACNTEDIHWFGDVTNPYKDQVNYGTGYNSSATGIVVDNYTRFKVGNLVRLDSSGEVVLVTSVASSYIGVVRDFGQSAEAWTARAASIVDNDYLTILGSSYEPGHPWPTIMNSLKVEYVNYIQDHRTSFGLTERTKLAKMRYDESLWSYEQRKKAIEHDMGIERQIIDGMPYASDKGQYVAATGNTGPSEAGGLQYFLSTYCSADHLVTETDLTEFEFIDWLTIMEAQGSDSKMLVIPRQLGAAFTKWQMAREFVSVDNDKMGLAIRKWVSPGMKEFYIVAHDYLKANVVGTSAARCLCLDLANIQYVNMVGGTTQIREGDPYRATGATLVEGEFQTLFSLRVEKFDTHGMLTFTTTS